jgi:hypothetical protein
VGRWSACGSPRRFRYRFRPIVLLLQAPREGGFP